RGLKVERVVAAVSLKVPARQREHVEAVMKNGTRAWLQQEHQRAADRGLARSGFADDAKRLAAADVEIDAIDRLDGGAAIRGLELDLEIAHRNDGVHIGGRRTHGWPTMAAIGAFDACCSAPDRSSSLHRQQRTLRQQ